MYHGRQTDHLTVLSSTWWSDFGAWHDTRKARNVHCVGWLCCSSDPRDKAFSEVAKLAGSNDLKLTMEDLHRGTRYLLLGKDGTVSKKLCVS